MPVRRLAVTVVGRSLDPAAIMWGDPSGGWCDPAVAWVRLLAGAGIAYEARTEIDASHIGPEDGVVVVADTEADWRAAEAAASAGILIGGAPPESPKDAFDLLALRLGALVRPDLRNLLVLRMDDPGAAVRAHLESWRHDPVEPAAWRACWEAIAALGRASVFCCPGWVNADGTVTASRDENPDEWQALDDATARGVIDLECHGFTHIHPDTAAWAAAADRFEDPRWYREMWPPRDTSEPAVDAQLAVLRQWQDACGPATTLVAPGEAWGLNTVAAARSAGLRLFTSWEVCRLDTPVPVWSYGIHSPYLDEPSSTAFEAGLPVVGYWHDRDMALHGASWVPEQLERWRDAGASRAIAFADLARVYATPADAALVDGEVIVRGTGDLPLLVDVA